MRKTVNTVRVEGWLYDHSLKEKVTGANSKNPNTTYLSGNVDIATDNAGLNVVTIHYTYVTPFTKSNKENPTYKTLATILAENRSVVTVGKENAMKLRADTSIGLNEFYSDKNNSGEKVLVSAKRNEGGFLHVVTDALNEDEDKRSTWEADTIITKVRELEADVERNIPEKVILTGYIFDFRQALLPVDFVVYKQKARDYFMGLDASPNSPTFMKLKGQEISQVTVRKIYEDSAFDDEPDVKEFKNTIREFVVTKANVPYAWDDEESITIAEMKEALANRAIREAEIKKNQEEWENSRTNTTVVKAPSVAVSTESSYDF